MTSLTTNAARGAQIDVRFPVNEPETVAGLIGQPSEVTITQYGGDNPLTSITYFGERTAECPHNNVSFYARDYDRDDLPAYAAGHLADAKRIAAEWSQS